ncbi:MAG TPA: ImcF-related family protein [Bryobacteraceae bacterium]
MTTLYIILGVTIVALIGLVIYYFIQKKKAKKAAEAMGDQSAAPGGDDISVLIHEAEAKLAAAKLENPKVGSLPVYLIVGEPGTTKTSVMLHCGLEPELIAGQAYQAGNVAPTRTANFWFSRRSLFVETGGALSSDLGKWRNAVKKLQPRSSVRKGEQAGRAAVVCFDCENFTKPGAADIVTNSARNLRARLGEVSQAMGINLPVYVLFTKIDRLPFFTEFVRNLNAEEGTQVLGVTLPMMYRRSEGVYAEEETARLTGSFERLFRSVADARPELLSREGDASKLPPEYEFPREFRKIRPAVVQFLVDLCRPSQLTVGPFLRGFYFTGVRPVIVNETAVVSPAAAGQGGGGMEPAGATGIFNPRMLQAQAAAPMQQASAPVTGSRKVPQWVFLSHLFNDILLADKVAMGASGSSIKTSTTRRILLIAAASLCFLLTVYFTVSYFNNHGLETEVRDAANGISATESAGGEIASLDSLSRLERLRAALETLVKYRKNRPWLYRGFLYIGDDLYTVARPIYCDRFRKLLLTQTQGNMLADMRSLPATTAPDAHPYQPTYDELKAYLITTTHPEKSNKEFLTPVLMRWWTNRHEIDAKRVELAQKQFDFYGDELTEDNPCSSRADSDAIARSRVYLKLFGGFEQLYGYLLAEADKHGKSINFNRDFPGSAAYVVNGYDVRAAFSKGGFDYMKANFGKADASFAGEQWVLGDQSGPAIDRAAVAQQLRDRYYQDFIKTWTGYIKATVVVRCAGLDDSSKRLRVHSSNTAPLLELSALASRNTAVDEPAVRNMFQPVQALTPPENTDHYIAPSNQNYINALVQLQSSIDSVGPPPNDAAVAQALTVAKQAEGSVNQVAQAFHIDAPIQGDLQRLLKEPITYAEGCFPKPGGDLNAKGAGMCRSISPLLAKYPFTPKAQAEAALGEIDAFFKPKDGALWKFVEGDLAKFIARQGTEYGPVPGSPVSISPAFLGWINRAASFTDAAYKDGSAAPHFNYSMKPQFEQGMQSVKLTIDGQATTFTPGSAAKPYVWPGTAAQGLQLSFNMDGNDRDFPTYSGLWAVFHFVAEANERNGNIITRIEGSGAPFRPTINPKTGKPYLVRIELNASPMIFHPNYFSLNCVSTVVR